MGGSVLSLLVTLSKYLEEEMDQKSLDGESIILPLQFSTHLLHFKTKDKNFLMNRMEFP